MMNRDITLINICVELVEEGAESVAKVSKNKKLTIKSSVFLKGSVPKCKPVRAGTSVCNGSWCRPSQKTRDWKTSDSRSWSLKLLSGTSRESYGAFVACNYESPVSPDDILKSQPCFSITITQQILSNGPLFTIACPSERRESGALPS